MYQSCAGEEGSPSSKDSNLEPPSNFPWVNAKTLSFKRGNLALGNRQPLNYYTLEIGPEFHPCPRLP